jgi:hypothetical protein
MAAANRIVFRTGFSEPMRISTTPGTTPAKDEIAEILIFGQEKTFSRDASSMTSMSHRPDADSAT